MSSVNCPHCQSAFQFTPEMAGQNVACPSCQQVVAIPADAMQPMASPVGEQPGAMSPAPAAKPKAERKTSKAAQIGLIVVLAVVVVGGLVYYLMTAGGGPAGAAYRDLKAAIQTGDFEKVYSMLDADGQKALDEAGQGMPELNDLEGAERYAKYIEEVKANSGNNAVAKMVKEWEAGARVEKVESEDDKYTIHLVYDDDTKEKLNATLVDGEFKFELKPSSMRLYSIIAANYAGGGGRGGSGAAGGGGRRGGGGPGGGLPPGR